MYRCRRELLGHTVGIHFDRCTHLDGCCLLLCALLQLDLPSLCVTSRQGLELMMSCFVLGQVCTYGCTRAHSCTLPQLKLLAYTQIHVPVPCSLSTALPPAPLFPVLLAFAHPFALFPCLSLSLRMFLVLLEGSPVAYPTARTSSECIQWQPIIAAPNAHANRVIVLAVSSE